MKTTRARQMIRSRRGRNAMLLSVRLAVATKVCGINKAMLLSMCCIAVVGTVNYFNAVTLNFGGGGGRGVPVPTSSLTNARHGRTMMRAVADDDPRRAVTLVTAYLPLDDASSKHSRGEYTEWMSNLLSLRDNVVVFTPANNVAEIERMRRRDGAEERRTRVIALELNDTFLAREKPVNDDDGGGPGAAFWDDQVRRLDPESDLGLHSKELYWIWNEKSRCLKKAADLDPFGTITASASQQQQPFFAWIDIGYLRTRAYNDRLLVRSLPRDLTRERMLVSNVASLQDESNKGELGGGFFGGSPEAVRWFHDAYYRDLRDDLDRVDVFVGKEQPRLHRVCEAAAATAGSEGGKDCLAVDPTDKYGGPWFSHAKILHHGEEDNIVLDLGHGAASAYAPFLMHLRKRTRKVAAHPSYTMVLHPFSEFVSDTISKLGCFECGRLRELQRVVSDLSHPVFVDVGGNIGQYGLAAAAAGADVFLFEPFGSNLKVLRDSVAANGPQFADRMTVFAAALTNETGRILRFDQPFEYPNFGATRLRGGKSSEQGGDHASDAMPIESEGEVEGVTFARGITLDSVIGTFPVGRPVVIKIDIEGGGCDVLEGATQFFDRHEVVYVSLELYSSASENYIPSNCDDPTGVFFFFERAGLRPYAQEGREPLVGDWDSKWSKERMQHIIWKNPELMSKMA